jgi:hypothetical protein
MGISGVYRIFHDLFGVERGREAEEAAENLKISTGNEHWNDQRYGSDRIN